MSLELAAITFAYPGQDRPVLDGFDLRLADGEAVAIMAPSGVGKSTVLGVAGLLLRPQSGTVGLDGRTVTGRDAHRLRGNHISQVFQAIHILPRRTVRDNIALPALINGERREEAEREAARLAADLGLGDLLDRPARHLSGGQAQRVGIARALVTRPTLVLADEPTANLDRATAGEVARLLFTLDRDRTSLLVATHDPAVAEHADRVIRLGGANVAAA